MLLAVDSHCLASLDPLNETSHTDRYHLNIPGFVRGHYQVLAMTASLPFDSTARGAPKWKVLNSFRADMSS